MTEDIRLIVEDDCVCACAGDARVARARVKNSPIDWGFGTRVSAAGIGGVRTEEGFRNRGIASRVMARALEESRRRGFAVGCVSTGAGNVARRLYAKAGYDYLFTVGLFERGVRGRPPRARVQGVEVRPYAPGDERGISLLWDRCHTDAGFFGEIRRDSDEWLTLRREQLDKDPESVWVAERGGAVIGWAEYYIHWMEKERCAFHVGESPGDAAVARSLLARVERAMARQGLNTMRFDASSWEASACRAIRDFGCSEIRGFVLQMALVDLQLLLDQLKPLIEKRARLAGAERWPGILTVEAADQSGRIELDGGDRGREMTLSGDRGTVIRVLCGRIGAWEAYLRGMLDVRGGGAPDAAFLRTVLGARPYFHPMRCRD